MRTINLEFAREWGSFTGDANPLHTDAEFAASTRFGVPIVHGHLLLCLAIEAAGSDGVSARFRVPVPVGSAVTLGPHGVELDGTVCVEMEPLP